MVEQTFQRFGVEHILILLAVPLLAAMCVWLTKDKPTWKSAVRWALAGLLAGVEVGWFLMLVLQGHFDYGYGLPLHLSDATVLLAVFAAFTLKQYAFDVVYYWALTAMPLTLLTPDLLQPFPDPYTIFFFLAHGLVVALALYLVWSGIMRPGPGSLWRSFVALNAFAAFVMLFNFAFETNYMFLRERPGQPTPLDWMGPWPFYIFAADIVALGLFALLYLPWRDLRQTAESAS